MSDEAARPVPLGIRVERAQPIAPAQSAVHVSAQKESRRERALERERREKLLGPLKKDIAQLEARIAQFEEEKWQEKP